MVALLAEGVDRNHGADIVKLEVLRVALLAEGVDRNNTGDLIPIYLDEVALLAEGVDRNWTLAKSRMTRACRPPRGGRG